ncbi:aspartate 1-decarboxylase [Marininema halotolerans]|uniref:Aspartate 1-decarboxylase n=1 Tax=Marininema halotolerans TaxID=1155944 RepID=A0A1I6NSD9_9BACL|nr:aspartate 1-decarboxylase [Marininema halotolerans]SFS30936.1 L-aspartate 1-decarboxylase [Marininema halotolerans]
MRRWMCKGKIHRATVTQSDLDYEGSIFLSRSLMKAAEILPYEMLQITSLRDATLWQTYAIPVDEEGVVGLNGPPAHLFKPGDLVVILNLGWVEEDQLDSLKPKVVLVDEKNRVTQVRKVTGLFAGWK